jgi:hypothetical protein
MKYGTSGGPLPFGFGAESASDPAAVNGRLLIGFAVDRIIGTFLSARLTLGRIVIDHDLAQ